MKLNAVLEKVEEIRRDVIARETAEVDRDYKWPEEPLRALQAAGVAGLVVPEECGGHGLGVLAIARTCELIGKECGSTALCFGMHLVASAVIAAKATIEQKERYLAPIAAGRHLTTLALSESGSGAHFYFPQTRLLAHKEGGYLVTGRKSFVTNAGHADSYVVSTMTEEESMAIGQFSCVVVPKDIPGLSFGPPWRGVGMRGNEARQVDLDGVHLERHNLLGEEGDQMWYVFNVVGPFFLAAMAGAYLGLAATALREAIAHVSNRPYVHSGSSLAASQVVQHRVGTLWAEVARTRQLLYRAAAEVDEGGKEALPLIFSAKAEVADCAVHVVNEAMTLMGGIAYREGGKMERLLRDVRAVHVMAPTTDILRSWTGRVLLGQPLLGD